MTISVDGLLAAIGASLETGGCGAGLTGTRLVMGTDGGFGAGRIWTRLVIDDEMVGDERFGLVAARGIGGGARGFSKLPSWFCGKRGLTGGDVTAVSGG